MEIENVTAPSVLLKDLQELAPYLEWIEKHWWIFAILLTWCIAWKGIALWRAARNKSLPWFIVLFLVNTLGILEIVYVLGFSRKKSLKEKLTSIL